VATDYGKLATPILDEVDNLEKVYKQQRPTGTEVYQAFRFRKVAG
jgi:hypothetical protein